MRILGLSSAIILLALSLFACGGETGPDCEQGCLIDAICVPDGFVNPDNACQYCDPALAATDWTNADGADCDDGDFCSVDDSCSGGVCAGTARDCTDGIACNGDETCDEDAGVCVAGTPTCSEDQLCDPATDTCVALCEGCGIDGQCVPDGFANPANPCQLCDVAASASAWTDADGTTCDDGLFCTVEDVCSGGSCSGSPMDCTDGIVCNGAETCDEDADACVAGTPACGEGQLCDPSNDTCVTLCEGCEIDGLCVPDGFFDPDNDCQQCDLATDPANWTALDGVTCDDELFCNGQDFCDAGQCQIHQGEPCDALETCHEEDDTCCVPEAYQACNPNSGDVHNYDSCDHLEGLVEDCGDVYGTCAEGMCACDVGWAGAGCCMIFVDGVDGLDANDGRTWAQAKQSLPAGMAAALDGTCVVWVKGGIYPGPFDLPDGLEIYGGFAGDEVSLEERDFTAIPSILDGGESSRVLVCNGDEICGDALVLDGFTIANGRAEFGGGMHIRRASPLLRNCRFEQNATWDGADNTDVSGEGMVEAFPGIPGGDGGAVYVHYGSPVFERCVFIDNHAGVGGEGGAALANDNGGLGFASAGGGGPGGDGGAIAIQRATLELVNCFFSGNSAGAGGVGGLAESTALEWASVNSGDGGDGGHGGGIAVLPESYLRLVNCRFINNSAGGGGAGSSATLGPVENREMASAWGGDGGGGGFGGAIYVHDLSSMDMANSLFVGNGSGLGGAGADGTVAAEDETMADAGAGDGGAGGLGGAIYRPNDLAIASCTLVDNHAVAGGPVGAATCPGGSTYPGTPGADGRGGGVYGDDAAVANSILWGNVSADVTQSLAEQQITGTAPSVSYSDVEGAMAGDGNLDEVPGFADAASGDFTLQDVSPCLGMGNESLLPLDAMDLDGDGDVTEVLPVDLDGTDRVQGSGLDMGCYER
ncbi:MAG: hypothetical protein JRF33_26150 [Deltaproteobacteria bacterium]|nr:hypothetical protein [Deltaproteobacteria bacterium]